MNTMVKTYIAFIRHTNDPEELRTIYRELDKLSDWYFDAGEALSGKKLTALMFLADAKADRIEGYWPRCDIAYGRTVTERWIRKALATRK